MFSSPNQKQSSYSRRTLSATVSKARLDVLKPKERLINVQKREKLKELLIIKFKKKYGLTNSEKFIEDEIINFLQGEKLTDADLQRLDQKIQTIMMRKKSKDNLVQTLKRDNTQPQLINKFLEEKPGLDNQEQTFSQIQRGEEDQKLAFTPTNTLRPFSAQCTNMVAGLKKKKQYKSPQEELAELEAEEQAAKPHIEIIDFSAEGDEWSAIAQYNKKQFDEEQIKERLKDKEVKSRIRDELDRQVKQKIKNEYENHLKSLEYDGILMKHLDHLKVIEKQKADAFKQQVLREKVDRENQMQDEITRKRIEVLKEKKFDREYVNQIIDQIEKEKQEVIRKKKKANDALHATLRENEVNRIKRAEALKQEKLDELRSCEEHGKTEDRRDNQRVEYFKRIERYGNKFIATKVKDVLEEMKQQNDLEEEKRKQVTKDKEKKDQDDEDRKKREISENKRFLKSYYDMQVEEKKKVTEFQRQLDNEQARIWNRDVMDWYDQEKDISQKIKKKNRLNFDGVVAQIEAKKVKKGINKRMTKEEYMLNRKLLEQVKSNK